MSLTEGVTCAHYTDIVLRPDLDLDYAKWKIKGGGIIENLGCKGMVVDIAGNSNTAGANIHIHEKNDASSQAWSVKSSDIVLSPASSSDNSQKNSNQTWTTIFDDPGYDLGLHPGFPGSEETINDKKCLSSAMDRDLAKQTMNICDESMSLLVGTELSLGTLKSIADLVNDPENGPSRMPGYCCKLCHQDVH